MKFRFWCPQTFIGTQSHLIIYIFISHAASTQLSSGNRVKPEISYLALYRKSVLASARSPISPSTQEICCDSVAHFAAW
jgi:hypothetical protein